MEDLDKEGKAQNSHNWTEDHMGGKGGYSKGLDNRVRALGPGLDHKSENSKTCPPFGTAQPVSAHPYSVLLKQKGWI